MPKGKKRTEADYEREAEQAVKRMAKYPEYLRSAKDSKTWHDFLNGIGINPDALENEKGSAFWEDVRSRIIAKDTRASDTDERQRYWKDWQAYRDRVEVILAEIIRQKADISLERGYYRTKEGKITRTAGGNKPAIILRDSKGRFVSSKKFERG